MTLTEFISSLTDAECVFLAVVFCLVIWMCIAPYYSLLHLGGIEKKLNKIADVLAELKRDEWR
jgi:hypothetical protein